MASLRPRQQTSTARSYGFVLAVAACFGLMCFLVGYSAGTRGPMPASAVDQPPGIGSPLGNMLGRLGRPLAPVGQLDHDPLESFMEVYEQLRANFYQPITEEDKTKLAYGAVRGMLRELGDPYTRFMDPKDYASFRQDTQGHFKGIGAELRLDLNLLRIVVNRVYSGNPAAKSGLQAGDWIVKVDDRATDDMSIDAVVALIRGEQGTNVTLTVYRPERPITALDPEVAKRIGADADEPRRDPAPFDPTKLLDIVITRDDVTVPIVESEMLPNQQGYIALNTFNEETYRQMAEAVAALEADGMKGLILDVRQNPGGSLEEVIKVVSYFVETGPVVHIEAPRRPLEALQVQPRFDGDFELPLVVMIDGMSASASEILAGALQDNRRATVVGEKSFGKGLVQTVLKLSDDSALVVTTSVYLTPNRRNINTRGIEPDIAVPWEIEARREALREADANKTPLLDWDLQVQAASQHLAELIAGTAKVGGPNPASIEPAPAAQATP